MKFLSHLRNVSGLNLSNNNFSGSVPKSLQRFPKSAFLGNNVSLMEHSVSSSPATSIPLKPILKPNKNSGKFSERALLGIIIAVSVLGIFGFAFLVLVCLLKRKTEDVFPGKLVLLFWCLFGFAFPGKLRMFVILPI